jgi:hypothetical protein
MFAARSIVEWCAFALLRLAATSAAAAGLAFLAAAGAVQAGSAATGASPDWVGQLVAGAVGLAVALLLAGGLSLYLRRARTDWLPDGLDSQASKGSGFDSWLILFPLTLIVVPLLMLLQLRPLADFWRDVLALADQVGFWQGLQQSGAGSGIVLIPIFYVLSLPAIETAAAVTSVVSSAVLLALMLVRSSRVPRALLLCAILQGGLVLAGAGGAVIVERLTPAIDEMVRSTPDPGGVEQTRVLTELQRYGAVVRGSSLTLAWGWGAMLLWAPVLILSALGRVTFAAVPGPGEPGGQDGDAPNYSTMEGASRERAYRDAARQIDRSTQPSRWF